MVPCTYCGVVADSEDHIPPKCMRKTLNELGNYVGVWREVPACRWCNSTLGHLALLTIADRRAYIKRVLRRKYRKLLSMPIWPDKALLELSDGLRVYVNESIERARLIRVMLAWNGQSEKLAMTVRGQAVAIQDKGNATTFVVTKVTDIGFPWRSKSEDYEETSLTVRKRST